MNRAFLSLPRSVCSHNNFTNPTFLEVGWNNGEFYLPQNFIRRNKLLLEQQVWDTCEHVQDAIFLTMETKKPLLWILDKGSLNCLPKITSINVHQNSISKSTNLEDIPAKKLSTIIIDPIVDKLAFIGLEDENFLIGFCLKHLKYWKIGLGDIYSGISGQFLAIEPYGSKLILCGRKSELFSINLDLLRAEFLINGHLETSSPDVTLEGEKLGYSSGLLADIKSGLHYFLIQDFAIVRWHIGEPLSAENHDIIAQSYSKLPFVSQLFEDPFNNIWALVNDQGYENCGARNETFEFSKRFVKIFKNKRFKESIVFVEDDLD